MPNWFRSRLLLAVYFMKINPMKSTLLAVLLFFPFAIFAQTWANPGATWYYDYSPDQPNGYIKIERIGESISEGHLCDVLKQTSVLNDSGSIAESPITFFTYQSNDTVYIGGVPSSNGSYFVPLYVFNLPSGAWMNSIFSSWKYDSTGYTNLLGQNLKTAYIHHDYCQEITKAVVFDKIGCEYFLMPQHYCPWSSFKGYRLRCYFDSTGLYYNTHRVPYCDYTSSDVQNDMLVYTDPSGITVSSALIAPGTIVRIYDIRGQFLSEKRWKDNADNGNFYFANPGLCSGVYFVRIITPEKTIAQKFYVPQW